MGHQKVINVCFYVSVCVCVTVCELCQSGECRFRARQTILNPRFISCFETARLDSQATKTAHVVKIKSKF